MLTGVKDNGPTLNWYWLCLLDYLCPIVLTSQCCNNQHSNYVIRNNSQAKIEDKEQEIIIKSMNYDALIYHENIYDTLIYM